VPIVSLERLPRMTAAQCHTFLAELEEIEAAMRSRRRHAASAGDRNIGSAMRPPLSSTCRSQPHRVRWVQFAISAIVGFVR
jgi:hypothetical protein